MISKQEKKFLEGVGIRDTSHILTGSIMVQPSGNPGMGIIRYIVEREVPSEDVTKALRSSDVETFKP